LGSTHRAGAILPRRASPSRVTSARRPRLLPEGLQALRSRLATAGGGLSIPLDGFDAIHSDAGAALVCAAEKVHRVAVPAFRAFPVPSQRLGLVLLDPAAPGLVHRAQTGHGTQAPAVGAAAIPRCRLGVVLAQ